MKRKVNLFVVGAMKAGTTSFNEMLAQHPEIYFSPVKEPHYFVKDLPTSMYSPSRFFDLEKYLSREFPTPLHIANLQTEEQYEKVFSIAPKDIKYLAEGSTGYLHAPESTALIHEYNPEAKIIILVREPLKRAYSHYLMNAGLGRETRSFEEAIRSDIHNHENHQLNPWSYVGMSLYCQNIDRFKKYFEKNVLVVDLSDYKENSHAFLETLYNFLEIEFSPLALEKKNASRAIKNKSLQRFIYQSGIRDFAANLLPQTVRQKIFSLLSDTKNPLELSEETTTLFYDCVKSQGIVK